MQVPNPSHPTHTDLIGVMSTRTQVELEVGVDGGVGGGPPELAVALALRQHRARLLVHVAPRDAKVYHAPVAQVRRARTLQNLHGDSRVSAATWWTCNHVCMLEEGAGKITCTCRTCCQLPGFESRWGHT